MSEHKLSEIEQLRLFYQEIIEGFSSAGSYRIRHFTELDNIDVLRKRIEFYNNYLAQGVPSEAERVKEIIASEEWSEAQENKILDLKYLISDNERNFHNLIPEQQPVVIRVIKEKKLELAALALERYSLLGLIAETESEQDALNYMIYLGLYKGDARLFENFEAFENQDDDTITEYKQAVDTCYTNFKESTIRQISVMPFFLNPFSYCKDTVHTFLDKPMSQLTNYQILLFSLGSRNINIISQAQGEPPDLMDDVPVQKIVDWYDQQYSVLLGKKNTVYTPKK